MRPALFLKYIHWTDAATGVKSGITSEVLGGAPSLGATLAKLAFLKVLSFDRRAIHALMMAISRSNQNFPHSAIKFTWCGGAGGGLALTEIRATTELLVTWTMHRLGVEGGIDRRQQ